MAGLSTTGSISFGVALVAGRNLVPRPAAGTTALRTPPTPWTPGSEADGEGDGGVDEDAERGVIMRLMLSHVHESDPGGRWEPAVDRELEVSCATDRCGYTS
jgi:hypothetical protein